MKKKALCVFILIFWMLVAVTMISMRVEKIMIPQVVTTGARNDRGASGGVLPLDALFVDDTGMHLYTTYEGTGWEAGERAREQDPSSYEVDFEAEKIKVEYSWGVVYIQYASKPIREGELVNVNKTGECVPDHWLAVFPEGTPEIGPLSEGVSIEERNGQAVQFSVEKAQEPYMDGRAKSMIPELREARVYSFSQMGLFLESLTAVGLVFAMLLAAVTLWLGSCFMAREAGKNWVPLLVNGFLALTLLVCLPLALGAVNLPSSMLPREQITDFGYFIRQYQEFFNALKSFSPGSSTISMPESEAGQAIVAYKNGIIMRPLLIMGVGIALPAALIVVERAVLQIRRRPRIK